MLVSQILALRIFIVAISIQIIKAQAINEKSNAGKSYHDIKVHANIYKRLPAKAENSTITQPFPLEVSVLVDSKAPTESVPLLKLVHAYHNEDETADELLEMDMSYGQIIFDANQLRNLLLEFHHDLKSYMRPGGLEFERFAAEYAGLEERFMKISTEMQELDATRNLLVKKVKDYFNKVSSVLHLLEVLCGLKLKQLESQTNSVRGSQDSLNVPQKSELKAKAANLVDVELYLSDLAEVHRKSRFHPDGFGSGAERANTKFETVMKESLELRFGATPMAKVTEEDLTRVEESLYRLNSRKKHFAPTKSATESATESANEGANEGASNADLINDSEIDSEIAALARTRQRFVVTFIIDRLRLVRDCLTECSGTKALGFHLYDSLFLRLRGVCDEIRAQLSVSEVLNKRSKRLLNYLLEATNFRLVQMQGQTISDMATAKSTSRLSEGVSPVTSNSRIYLLDEMSGVKGELENTLAVLKRLHDGHLALSSDKLRELYERHKTRWDGMCIYLQERDWYWSPQLSEIKMMECEIGGILKTLRRFLDEAPKRKKNVLSVTLAEEVGPVSSLQPESEETETLVDARESQCCGSKWGCCL